MAYWLIKSEPFKYSWDQFVKDKKTFWDGVRNYAARNNLKAMKKGDLAFFYHSNEGVEIVGIAKVVKEAYPDPTIDDERWVAVDFSPVKKLKNPVTLAQIKVGQYGSGSVRPTVCADSKTRRVGAYSANVFLKKVTFFMQFV